MAEDELQALRQASDRLLYPSESDEPIEVFAWDAKEEDARSAVAARSKKGSPIEEVALNDFFGELESSDEGARFRELHRVLSATLSDVRVFRVGEVQVDIYVVGLTQSRLLAGLHTISVET